MPHDVDCYDLIDVALNYFAHELTINMTAIRKKHAWTTLYSILLRMLL